MVWIKFLRDLIGMPVPDGRWQQCDGGEEKQLYPGSMIPASHGFDCASVGITDSGYN
jgi:hypothetical protein